ncbi:GntR family transcriptional regulator [Peribacillus simplex]|uniref:GntR family transcriptional regulator n=1 Tax=Peribacillus simplex TaxID=1478 RepID=UPI002E208EF8|nr:GntR family transcriptional regulator [Peribacillus simplex]MED3912245.1 GntR family transcriptional regulator [Peribacillus simplex]
MGKIDIYAVIIAGFSDKVAKIYFYDGLIFYFTSNKSVRVDFSFDSRVRMSRTPIRSALQRLEHDGLVRIHPKQGIYIYDISVKQVN